MASYNLTSEDVAERYGLSPDAVRRLVRVGRIRALNVGTRRRHIYRFSEADLERWEKSCATS